MLKAALHQLNSEPIVLLKKIEKCVKNKLPDRKANIESDAMPRYHIVKKSPDPRDLSSTSLNLKINLTGGVPTCLKRKASLEEAFTEADAVYETPKKQKRDESVESDIHKKKFKQNQTEIKTVLDQKHKISEINDKEKGKLKKKLEKGKLKSSKPEHHSETGAFTKPETATNSLSSSELPNKHSPKKDKKHERKKKKSKERSRESSRSASKDSMSGSKEQFCSDEITNGNGEPDALISQGSDNTEEVSIHSPKPTSSSEAITDEEVEDSEDQIGAVVQDESNSDVPRSDSAATVALDIEIDRQSINSSIDETQSVECVNLVSPEKAKRPAGKTSLPSDETTDDEMEFQVDHPTEIEETCKRELFEEDKRTHDEVELHNPCAVVMNDAEPEDPIPVGNLSGPLVNIIIGRSTGVGATDQEDVHSTLAMIEMDNITPIEKSINDSECLQIDDMEESICVDVGKPESGELDSMEDQSDTLPLEGLEKGVMPVSDLEAQRDEKAAPMTKAAGSPSSVNHKTDLVVPVPVILDNSDGKPGGTTLVLIKKPCCMSIDVPIEQLDQREWDIRLEQVQIQTALAEMFAERRTLNKELRLLESRSRKLEQKSSLKNIDISANVLTVKTLSDAVNIAREERNRLAADKKKTHHMVLQTEIKLRELQVQLIRQQLDLGDAKPVESNPLLDDITENEKRVADLTEEVANKSEVHKETDIAHQKAEQLFRQKNEEHETLLKGLEEARQTYQELNDDLSEVTSEIEKTKSKLEVLADEGKKKCLRMIDIEEESIKIESCKKLKQIELKRQKITAIKDAITFEEMIPNLYDLFAVESPEEETASESTSPQPPKNSASKNVDSPNQEPSPSRPFVEQLPCTVPAATVAESTLVTEETETFVSETLDISSELPSHVDMGNEELSPQTQPICLAIQNVAIMNVSPARSNTPALGSPSITQSAQSSNPVGIRMADSMNNAESVQASTSQNLTTASFAVLPQAISLKSLSDAYPFYAQFIHSNSPTANSDDETILYQEIVNGCRQFTNWKCNYSSKDISSLSRDNPLLRQGAGYMTNYFIPFYRLMIKKNSPAVLLFDSIVLQAQKANWYGMPAVDSTYMKQMLENNVRCAIDIGTKFKEQAHIPPSRVEFSPSSGKSSMPVFTIHLATPEGFRSSTSANQMQIPAKNTSERSMERNQANRVMQGDHSPIGALSSMANHVRPVHHQTSTFTHNSPNGLMTEGHSNMPRQSWPGNSESNGLTAYPSTVVQNTAVVIPTMNAQYTGRHRMPAVQQLVPPPNSTWSQQQSAHQAYVQSLQSSRVQVPANYQAGPYRQQQATLQHQYTSHSSLQPMGQSQQLQHRLVGPIAGDNLSRQGMTLLGSHLQGQIPVQRARQHSTAQQSPNQQSGSHHIAGIQQAPQSHSSPSGHQSVQNQRQKPMSSPPVNAQSQRHFVGQSVEASRQPVTRRPSREAPQHQVYTCLKCGQEAQQKCSGCQTTFYCSRDCQVAHWEEHGKTCSKQV